MAPGRVGTSGQRRAATLPVRGPWAHRGRFPGTAWPCAGPVGPPKPYGKSGGKLPSGDGVMAPGEQTRDRESSGRAARRRKSAAEILRAAGGDVAGSRRRRDGRSATAPGRPDLPNMAETRRL